MGWFITAIVFILIGLGASYYAASFRRKMNETDPSYEAHDMARLGSAITRIVAGVSFAFGLLGLLFSMVYSQGVGEAKVIVNLDGTIAGEKLEPGFGFKAPWQDTVDFDLFSQEALFAGNQAGTPSYSGGSVTGFEITSAVAGGAQVNFDLSVVYSLNPDKVTEIYTEFRTQERFTAQVVEKTLLTVSRDVPTAYAPIEFRGDKRGEAMEKMLNALNQRLGDYGVTVSIVNLQNVRYTEEVETSIKNVEVAQQREQQAAAELRATEISAQTQIVEAEARATAAIAEAQGQAEANRLLAESLTDEILLQRYIEKLGQGTVYVVPEGSTPLISATPR